MLEAHELQVTTAESAEEALEHLNDHRPDVIFMDHMMPGMDGFEAVSAIKNNPATATIPIMMYTSQKGELYVGQARALGAVGVLPKEVEPVEVSKVLASLRVIDTGGEVHPDQLQQADNAHDVANPEVEQLDKNLQALIEDLFAQQRSVIRQELLDNYEVIATRVADELQISASADVAPTSEQSEPVRSPRYRSAVLALSIFAFILLILFAELHFRYANTKGQYATLLKNIEVEQANRTQDIIGTNDRIAGYQQSVSEATSTALTAIEWGINESSSYEYGQIALGDYRLPAFETMLAHLELLNFSGEIRIDVHIGDFCLSRSIDDNYSLAIADWPIDRCDLLGYGSAESVEMGAQQSVAFANFINTWQQRTVGQIRFQIESFGNNAPLIDYPISDVATTAGKWNRVAAENNRIVISFRTD